MTHYRAQDFARCAGNPCRLECETCARNERNSAVHPDAQRQVWLGVWVIEDERCPSRVEMEAA